MRKRRLNDDNGNRKLLFLEGVATCGTYEADDTGRTECKTEAEFKSGEVTWLMQNGQGSLVWGQSLDKGINNDAYPLLTNVSTKRVIKWRL